MALVESCQASQSPTNCPSCCVMPNQTNRLTGILGEHSIASLELPSLTQRSDRVVQVVRNDDNDEAGPVSELPLLIPTPLDLKLMRAPPPYLRVVDGRGAD